MLRAHLAACHSGLHWLNLNAMLTPRYLVGFTGHRSGFDSKLIRPALTQVLADLKAQAAKMGSQQELYTGIAEGCDTLCVEIARELDLPVHLLLPLDEQVCALAKVRRVARHDQPYRSWCLRR